MERSCDRSCGIESFYDETFYILFFYNVGFHVFSQITSLLEL